MSANRKLFIEGTVVELCSRTEAGLPMVANPLVIEIIRSILARAQTLYPFTLCHLLAMANHVHILGVVENPEHVCDFMEYFKRESSIAINRLLGRRKRTVWAEGYDSPTILDAEKCVERIVYIYANPQKAGLVQKIEEYPNINTWREFLSGATTYNLRRFPRDCIPTLPKKALSNKALLELLEGLKENALEENQLVIEPDAWMQCFAELEGVEFEVLNQEIVERVRTREAELDKERTSKVLGAHALRIASIHAEYEPKNFGKRMACLCSIKQKRIRFLKWFKSYCASIRPRKEFESLADWLASIPPGLFAPGGYLQERISPSILATL